MHTSLRPRAPRLATHRVSRLALRLLATVTAAIGVGAWGFAGSPVSAETELVSSSPANGEELLTQPTAITVVFNEAVPANSVVQAVCKEQPAPIGPVAVGADGISLTVAVTGALPIGTCNVTYSVPQADGKVVTGGFSFEILDPATVDPGDVSEVDPTDGGNLASDPPPVSGPLGLARVVSYVFLAALFGGAALIVLAWPEGAEYDSTARFLRMSWLLAAVSSFFVVVLQTSLSTGRSVGAALSPAAWTDLFDHANGAAAVARFVLVLLSAGMALRPDRLLDPQQQLVSLGLPGLAVVSLALTRAGDGFSLVGTLAGAFHNVSVALWFGGLLLLAQSVLISGGEEDLVHAVRGYTRLAPAFVTVAAVSGLVHLYQLDGGAILSSRHGRLVVLKVVGVAAMVYLGMVMRQVVATRLKKATQLPHKLAAALRKAVTTELAFGLFVFAITSWSVATLPDTFDPPGTDRTNYAFVGDRSGGAFDVQVKITPAQVGLNAVRIDVHSPESGLTDLKVQFNPPSNTTASITLSVPLDGVGAARLPLKEGIPFGAAGLWTVIVTGNGPDGPLPSVQYNVSVTSASDSAEVEQNGGVSGSTTTVVGATSAATAVTTASGTPATVIVPVGGATTSVPQVIQPVTAAVTSVP